MKQIFSRSMILILTLLVLAFQISAQNTNREIAYGETLLGRFDEANSDEQRWTFTAEARDLFSIRVQRIGGQFSPQMTILSPSGDELTPSQIFEEDRDREWLFFADGTETGEYRVEVSGEGSSRVDNPNEYSLSLRYEGKRLADMDEGLVALPEVNSDDIPNLQEGTAHSNELGFPYYGDARLSQPDARTQRNRWILEAGGFSIDMDNANPLSRGIASMSIVDDGLGFTMLDGVQFFSTKNITSLSFAQSIINIGLEDGRTISTDFYRIRQIQVLDDLVLLTSTNEQRIIFVGQSFDFRRRGGINGEGPNVEPVNLFNINSFQLHSDLSLFHTLYYNINEPEIRILYGTDMRFIGTYLHAGVYQRGNQEKPELNDASVDSRYIDISFREAEGNNPRNFSFAIDPFAMGDVYVDEETILVKPLDGREISETTLGITSLLIENRGIRFTRSDASHRLSLPDGTDITMPAAIPANRQALPNDTSYRPSNANNLGTELYDYHPHVNWDEFLLPVNPINGNFFYAVDDIAIPIPSHTLSLNWTRYYNSLSPHSLTPDYQANADTAYLLGQMGAQWRHSYQYELDIRYMPLNEVWMILPDGSRHIFTSSDALNNLNPIFRSRTLMSWEIRRENGLTSIWIARNGDGEIYEFDRAGRLERISNLAGDALLFSPAPRDLVEQYEQIAGFFITEKYGRRIEVYTDEANQIRLTRQQFEYRYEYDNSGYLTHVQYPSILENQDNSEPNYIYSGQLSEIRDRRSPYHPEMGITYQEDGRVASWRINLDERGNSPAIITEILYENTLTTATILSNDIQQSRRTTYDSEQRIAEHSFTDGTNIRTRAFAYDAQTGRLYQFRQINGGRYSFVYNEWGYLSKLTSPASREHNFEYRTGADTISRWLTRIQYPDSSEELFSYDEATNQLISNTKPLDNNRRLISNYEYDEFGRVARILAPNPASESSPLVTEYSYDDFGYPIQIQRYDAAQTEVKQTLQLRFDISGRLVEIEDWRGNPISIEWDNQRNLMIAYTYGDVSRIVNRLEFQYDEYAQLIERRSQNLSETFTYNGLNLLASSSDGMGRISSYHYDNFGNLIEKISPTETNTNTVQSHRYRYNGLSELIEYILPNQERYLISHDIQGLGESSSFSVQTPDGQTVRYTYNVDNQLAQVNQFSSSGSPSYSYSLNYDALGNLINLQETHATGRNLQISYNAARLPISTRIANVSTNYTYNHAGQLIAVTNPDGVATSYVYDTWGNIIQVSLPDNDSNSANPLPTYQYAYDENGNLTSFTDALEHSSSFTYDDLNRLISMRDPLGNETSYAYDERDNIISVTYPNGNAITAEYNDANLITRWIDPSQRAINYRYDNANRLIEILDRDNVQTSFTYDAIGNLVARSVTASRETLYSYDNANRLISETNALGQTSVYYYNNLNRISQIVDSLGNIERYTWTGAGYLNIYTNQSGQNFDYVVDPLGRLQQMNSPSQLERFVMTYTDGGLVESIRHNIENLSNDYNFTYYPNGLIASIQAPEMDGTWEFSYDAMQHLTTASNPEGDEITYSYDELGRMTSRQFADGSSETWEYDLVGNILRYTATNGMVSNFQYDANNRVSIRTDEADGQSRQYSYSYSYNAPQLIIIDPNNQETRYYYDSFGNVTLVEYLVRDGEEENIISISYEYDSLNNLLGISFPAINSAGIRASMRFSYNALNQLTRYIDASGGSWAYGYDSLNNLNLINDPLGNVISYEYDANNRIVQARYSNGSWAEFRYNVRANTLSAPENRSQSQENRTPILYSFDFHNRLINIEHSANSQISFERDDLGRVTSMRTANGATIQFEYNHRNQVTNINAPEGNISHDYDALGNLVSSSGNGQSAEFTYNGFGYLTEFQQDSHRVNYEWDTIGNLLHSNSSLTGETNYSYDAFYRLTEMQSPNETVSFTRNENAWATSSTYESGLVSNIVYTESGRIENLSYRAGSSSYAFSYQYDSTGNLVRANRSDINVNGAPLVTRDTLYTYGRNNVLIGERWLNDNNEVVYAVTYTYDLAGNLIQAISYDINSNPTRTIYVYNQYNQLVEELRGVPSDIFDRYTGNVINPDASKQAREHLAYEYDNAGNLTSLTHPQGRLSYRYDSWNRLIEIGGENLDGTVVNTKLQYTTLGQIQRMELNEIRYSFLYDGNRLIAIRNDTEDILETYHYSPDGLLLWRETDAGIQYPIIDALKNIRLWINADGTSIDGSRGINLNGFGLVISPYGAESAMPLADTPQMLYGGQIYEPSSQLYLLGLRAYSPAIGRFIQRDPVRHDPQSSLYTYVQNRPTFATDFSGMIAELGFVEAQTSLYPSNNFTNQTRSLLNEPAESDYRINQAQSLEDARLLNIAAVLRQNFNQSGYLLDSAFCLRSFAGMSNQSSNFSWLPRLELLAQSNTWIPSNMPDPSATSEHNRILSTANEYTSISFNNLQALNTNACDYTVEQASVDFGTGFNFVLAHDNFKNLLSANSLVAAYGSESNNFFNPESNLALAPNLNPNPSFQALPLPILIPESLYMMQSDSFGFLQAVLLPTYNLDAGFGQIEHNPIRGFSFETYIQSQ